MANLDLTFNTVDVPEQTRIRKENPFTPVVAEMVADGKAREFSLPRKNDDDEKAIASAVQQFQQAGREQGVTVRKTVKTDTKAGTATITVWTVPQIKRERKPADTADAK